VSDLAIPAWLGELLGSSLHEQAEVTVYFRSGEITGVVARLESDVVELRLASRRCVIRLDRIDAIVKQ
jgi:hypothetical protein